MPRAVWVIGGALLTTSLVLAAQKFEVPPMPVLPNAARPDGQTTFRISRGGCTI
jgi:hypothetical protein